MDIADVFWIAMQDTLKESVRLNLRKYEENKKYTVYKYYDGLQLTGFCVYHDETDFRVLDECHYIGINKYAALKMWKFMTSGQKRLKIICQKANTKMAEFYKKIGFTIIGETGLDFTFSRVK